LTADDATLSRLAALAQTGDRTAYAALLTAAQRWLLGYYRRRVPPCEIDDLVQETLLSIHRKLASYDPARGFTPWLAAIARFRFIDHLRQVYRHAHGELDHDIPVDSGEEAIGARVSFERLFEALPGAQQRAIELVKIAGLSVSEAAQSTGQSESLVKVNIHRGLKRLAKLVEKA
jgi:RNA polymerase sigma factor (sigma-70 family)